MAFILQKALILALCISSFYAAICPSGTTSVSNFTKMSGDDFAASSQHYDVMYEIQQSSGIYTLVGFKLKEVDNVANAYFDVDQFTLVAKATWKVAAVSELGNCVIIEDRPSLYAYQTSLKTFTLVQTLTANTYSTVSPNDDCTIIRLALTDGSQKVYLNSVENSKITFPKNSMFDSYFVYGLDTTKTLKKVSATGISPISISSSNFEQTPVSIMNRKDLKSLIVVSNTASTSQYTVTIINTVSEQKVYSRSWPKTSYTAPFVADISTEGPFVLLRDSNGFVLLLKIQYSADSGVTVTEIDEQNTKYKTVFGSDAVISLTSTAVITYLNGKLTYFQSFDKTLYYLAQIVVDLETEASKYVGTAKSTTPLIPTLIQPGSYDQCSPVATKKVDIEKQAKKDEVKTTKAEDGTIIKCQQECLSCTNQGKCEVCSIGYSLADDGTCVFCQDCKSCFPSNPQICLSCFSPKILNATTHLCDTPKCTENYCVTCNPDGTCAQCFKGYSNINGKCTKCQDGCPSCSAGPDICDQTSVTASGCKLGFVYKGKKNNATDFVCVQCAAGCLGCTASDISNCTFCNSGYYGILDSATNILKCKQCISNCEQCSDATSCTTCSAGYQVATDKTCIVACDKNCQTCEKENPSSCLTCYSGSKLQSKTCVADLSCNPTKTCKTCGDGYTLKNSQCIKCQTTDDKCTGCQSSNVKKCLSCKSGYYLNTGRQCVQCSLECKTCQNKEACITCSDGYYLVKTTSSITGKCVACIQQCKTCSQFDYLCLTCQTGYFLDGTKCITRNYASYSTTVISSVSQVILYAKSFMDLILQIVNEKISGKTGKTLTSHDITVRTIVAGSAVISGSISTSTTEASSQAVSELAAALPGKSVDGFVIQSIQVTQKISVDPTTTPTDTPSSNIGIILGVVIPLALIILIGIIIIVVRLSKRKEKMDSDIQSNEAYFVNQSQKYVDPYSQESDKI